MQVTLENITFKNVEVDFDFDSPEPESGYRGGYTLNSVKIDGCYIDKIWQHSDLRDQIIQELEDRRDR